MSEVTLQPDETASKDAYIYSAAPTTNYNNSNIYARTSFGNSQRGLIEFDLSSYIGNGYSVSSAILTLYCVNTTGDALSYVHRITGSWDETSVTWNTQPSHDASSIDDITLNSSSSNDYDVTSLVQNWFDETYSNYGFKIISNELASSGGYFWSSAYSTAASRPKLYINYTLPIIIITTKTDIAVNTTTPVLSTSATLSLTKTDIAVNTTTPVIINIRNPTTITTKSDISVNITTPVIKTDSVIALTNTNIDVNTTNITVDINKSPTIITTKSNISVNVTNPVINTDIILTLTKANIDVNTTNPQIIVPYGIYKFYSDNINNTFYSQSKINTFYANKINKTFYA